MILLFALYATCFAGAVDIGKIYRDTIVDDVVLLVPAEYSTIQDALLFLDDKRIATGVDVIIQIADGTYTNYNSIIIDHLQGDHIKIVGNQANPLNVVIKFTSDTDGVVVQRSKSLKLLDGITLDGNNEADKGGSSRKCVFWPQSIT